MRIRGLIVVTVSRLQFAFRFHGETEIVQRESIVWIYRQGPLKNYCCFLRSALGEKTHSFDIAAIDSQFTVAEGTRDLGQLFPFQFRNTGLINDSFRILS